jgi:hypothetical protein
MSVSAGSNFPSGGSRENWRTWDHGSPAVDQFWRNVIGRGAIQRHASLGGAIPPEDAKFVPPEFENDGRIPESWFICEQILAAS